MNTTIDFKRINNDVNGNPRYVCHFLSIPIGKFSEAKIICSEAIDKSLNNYYPLKQHYKEALRLAKTIGGKKYNNKSYGGGIVFQSYNLLDTEKLILGILK